MWTGVDTKLEAGKSYQLKGKEDGFLFKGEGTVHLKDLKIIGGGTHLAFRQSFTLKNTTLMNFGADGVLIQASNCEIDGLQGILPTDLIPYAERHPDFIQFAPIDSKGKVDPNGVIENVTIKNVYLYAPDIPEKGFRGCQGITSFEGKVKNVTLENFVILTDVEQHGVTFISAHNCTFVNGVIDSIRTEELPGFVLSNRKTGEEGTNNRAINVIARFKDVKGLIEEDITLSKRDLSIKGLCESEGLLYAPTLTLKLTEGGVPFRLGRASMLFERHKHSKSLTNNGFDIADLVKSNPKFAEIIGYTNYANYGTYQDQLDRFDLAASNSVTCACESVSLGNFQIGVWGWKKLGYSDAQHMYESMQTEEGQNEAFIKFVKATPGLKQALNRMDIPTVKRLYNGSKFLDRDRNGVDDWTDKYTKELARVLGRVANPDKRIRDSTTVKTETKKIGVDLVKGTVLTTVLTNGDEIISATKILLDKASQFKDTLDQNKILLDSVKTQVDILNKDMSMFNYIIIGLLILIALKLFGGLATIRNYLYDRGYTKHKEKKDVWWSNKVRK